MTERQPPFDSEEFPQFVRNIDPTRIIYWQPGRSAGTIFEIEERLNDKMPRNYTIADVHRVQTVEREKTPKFIY